MSKREWDTPIREPWNPVIHQLLKAVDNHMMLYLRTKNLWHLSKARDIRSYIRELKDYIKEQESIGSENE